MSEARVSPRPVELGADWLVRLGLGGLFIFAAVAKLRDPGAFAVEIANYLFLSSLAPYLAIALPGVELLLGVALIAGPPPWRKAAALGLMLLLAVFTVAVTQVVARHINVDCGCFGKKEGPVTALTIVRDVALFAAALLAYRLAGPIARDGAVSAP